MRSGAEMGDAGRGRAGSLCATKHLPAAAHDSRSRYSSAEGLQECAGDPPDPRRLPRPPRRRGPAHAPARWLAPRPTGTGSCWCWPRAASRPGRRRRARPTTRTSAAAARPRPRPRPRPSGVARLVLLGYGDSGSDLARRRGRWPAGSFCAARRRRGRGPSGRRARGGAADLLVADDVNGGYGHPDHRRVHGWRPAGVGGHRRAAPPGHHRPGVPLRWHRAGPRHGPRGPGRASCRPTSRNWYTAPRRASPTPSTPRRRWRPSGHRWQAHATQATGAPDTVRTLAVFLGLPDEVFALAFSTEWFVVPARSALHRGPPRRPRARLDDLFAPAIP